MFRNRDASEEAARLNYPSLSKLTPQELQELVERDHGKDWPGVLPVVSGKAAERPVDMLRARYTAMRFKDHVFLAKTETAGGVFSIEDFRLQCWEETLGLRDPNKAVTMPLENIRYLDRLEIIDVQDLRIFFRLHCGQRGSLFEQGVFKEDKNFGYVYSIDDIQESRWEDGSERKMTEANPGTQLPG